MYQLCVLSINAFLICSWVAQLHILLVHSKQYCTFGISYRRELKENAFIFCKMEPLCSDLKHNMPGTPEHFTE